MELTWMHIFLLVERMWGLNQNKIAYYLGIAPSTISRLKSGKQSKFERPFNELYRNLFDSTNSQIPAFGKDSKELLKDLKEEIEDAGWSDSTKGLKDNDYEKFVFGLFRLANENQYKLFTESKVVFNAVTENKSSNQKTFEMQSEQMFNNCSVDQEGSMPTPSPTEKAPPVSAADGEYTPINEVEDISSNIETPVTLNQTGLPDISNETTSNIDVVSYQLSKEMLKIFEQEYSDCHIKEFLANDLCKEISRDTLTWVDRFVETIESDIIQIYSGERLDAKTKMIYDNISRYAKTLCKYKNDLVERIKKVHEWRRNAPSALASSINRYLINHPGEDTVTVEPYCEPVIDDEFLQHTRKKLDTFHTQICGNDNN